MRSNDRMHVQRGMVALGDLIFSSHPRRINTRTSFGQFITQIASYQIFAYLNPKQRHSSNLSSEPRNQKSRGNLEAHEI